ncbi:hypothetical protein HS1genome_1227 [Sulfodiicoccus acidiphilus]|uniref:Tr-type G domain-containing protein n=1 Tax=Sulfodiicoccus acidiphilus TaxID=1670455 RepID=A0A348B3T6_9CREN|nr:hypothetical protein HS1genome_1227 [Sulfodiicoccus acidiphilus]
MDDSRLQELATQMRFRLEEGGGEAFYILGVADSGDVVGISDDELRDTVEVLSRAAELVRARIAYTRVAEVRKGGKIAEVLVRLSRESLPIQVNVAVMGHVNAGKSTLTGALVHGKLDDGNGKLRSLVSRYLHEIMTGRTSSITMRLLGFDESNSVVNWSLRDPTDEAEVMMKSTKVVRLIDLGGHERYLRTTLKGLMGYEINYVCLVVGADDGLSAMGKEHLAVAAILKLPIFVVITKVDKMSKERVEHVMKDIKAVLKVPGINRLSIEVDDEDDVVNALMAIRTARVVPVFRVSNVTGSGLDLLLRFINMLPPKGRTPSGHPLVYIDDVFNVQGTGVVVLGSVVSGTLEQNDVYLLGPNIGESSGKLRSRAYK